MPNLTWYFRFGLRCYIRICYQFLTMEYKILKEIHIIFSMFTTVVSAHTHTHTIHRLIFIYSLSLSVNIHNHKSFKTKAHNVLQN